MLKKLSVISEGYSLNVDIQGEDIALINLQSFGSGDRVDTAEVVATHEDIEEMIRMLEHASSLLS